MPARSFRSEMWLLLPVELLSVAALEVAPRCVGVTPNAPFGGGGRWLCSLRVASALATAAAPSGEAKKRRRCSIKLASWLALSNVFSFDCSA